MSNTKSVLTALRTATADFDADRVQSAIAETFTPDTTLHLCHPFGDQTGGQAYFDTCLAPVAQAMPDLERREMIAIAGTTPEGQTWVATMGSYIGSFLAPFLGIPPTGHLAHMRFHEYFKLDDDKVTEVQMIWDIPELMMQAGAWPMAPQLGKFLNTPAPMTQDGLTASGDGSAAMQIVIDMLNDLCRHPAEGGPEVMQLEKYWHPRMNWYGPAGIGTARGTAGFRHWHQIPFLRAMPDRKLDAMGDLMSHWISEGTYVAETGWPNMRLTLTHDGWIGIAPAGKEVLLRSLDFWRIENGLIRENWVLVDLLDLYQQVGVDVLARMQEFNKARNTGPITLSNGMTA